MNNISLYMAAAAVLAERMKGYSSGGYLKEHHPGPHLKKVSKLGTPSNIPDKKYKGTPRNEMCPCGSNKKYKKCCGR